MKCICGSGANETIEKLKTHADNLLEHICDSTLGSRRLRGTIKFLETSLEERGEVNARAYEKIEELQDEVEDLKSRLKGGK